MTGIISGGRCFAKICQEFGKEFAELESPMGITIPQPMSRVPRLGPNTPRLKKAPRGSVWDIGAYDRLD